MSYKSLYKDVIFIEGPLENCSSLGEINFEKTSFFNQQLKGLSVVKEQFVEKAHKLGGNIIINFKYGQKQPGLLKQMFVPFDDNVNRYASGEVVKLDLTDFEDLKESLNK